MLFCGLKNLINICIEVFVMNFNFNHTVTYSRVSNSLELKFSLCLYLPATLSLSLSRDQSEHKKIYNLLRSEKKTRMNDFKKAFSLLHAKFN